MRSDTHNQAKLSVEDIMKLKDYQLDKQRFDECQAVIRRDIQSQDQDQKLRLIEAYRDLATFYRYGLNVCRVNPGREMAVARKAYEMGYLSSYTLKSLDDVNLGEIDGEFCSAVESLEEGFLLENPSFLFHLYEKSASNFDKVGILEALSEKGNVQAQFYLAMCHES